MKPTKSRRYVWLVAVALLGVAISCDKQDIDRTFEGPYFVRFTDSSLTFRESYSPVIPIQVHNVGPVLNEPIRISYTISGNARAGREYQIQGETGTVIIPANKSFGVIGVKLINGANNILESRTLVLTLTGVQPSTLQVGLGQAGVLGKSIRVVINDDCLFGGSYTGTARIGGQTVSVPDIDISSGDCKTYTLSNWNVGLNSFAIAPNLPLFDFQAIKPTLRFIDNGDNSIAVPAQSNSQLGPSDTLQGNGAWNPRDKRITLNLQTKVRLQTTRNGVQSVRDTTVFFTQTYTPQ